MPAPPLLSLCMIVRDEEEMLPDCLRSAAGVVDEVAILDTGSRDRTIEIARGFGARVETFPWPGDFSKARNESLRHARGEWILILDADEILQPDGKAGLAGRLKAADVDVLTAEVLNPMRGGMGTGTLVSERLFRNGRGFHYEGRVHNQLMPRGPSRPSGLRILHKGYALSPEKMDAKNRRTTALLEQQIAEHPQDPFARMNLAVQYILQERHAEAVDPARLAAEGFRSRPASPERDFARALSLDLLGLALAGVGRPDEGIAAFREALRTVPAMPDAWFDLAWTLQSAGKAAEAREAYEGYFRAVDEWRRAPVFSNFMLRSLDSAYVAHCNSGVLRRQSGDRAGACKAFEEALRIRPDFGPALINLGNTLADGGDFAGAYEAYRKVGEAWPRGPEYWQNLAAVCMQLRKPREALEACEKAAALVPQAAKAWWNLAVARDVAGDGPGARLALERLLALEPGHAGAKAVLARMTARGSQGL